MHSQILQSLFRVKFHYYTKTICFATKIDSNASVSGRFCVMNGPKREVRYMCTNNPVITATGLLNRSHFAKQRTPTECRNGARCFSGNETTAKPPESDPDKPDTAILAYKGTLVRPVKLTKMFSISSSLLAFMVQPTLIKQVMAGAVNPAAAVAVGTVFCFFTYVTPILIHWLTKRYVIDMYFEPQSRTFTCTTFTFLGTRKKTTFKVSDVHIPELPGIFTTLLVKGKPLFFEPSMFLDAEAYEHLFGFDAPLDLKLGDPLQMKKSKVDTGNQ